jgi:3-oxoacyl-[acyl-carrier protein] reductase
MLAEREQDERIVRRDMYGHTAIVTGAASGLGREIALAFARRGVNIAFNYIELPDRDISAQALLTETTLRACGVEVYSEHCDVRDSGAVADFVEHAVTELGGVHYLVNNAGIAHDGALWRMTDEAWNEVIDTNLTGSFNCIRSVTPHLRRQRYGKIVSIGSHQAYKPGFGIANYTASKAALVGLTKAAAVDLGAYNINVNAVAPGFVNTELLRTLPSEIVDDAKQESVLGRIADPEDVSNVVLFLCSDDARHITGQVILVDGGLTLH